MVIGIIFRGAQFVFRHRETIYKVLTAQDRYIGGAFRRGGYSKATQYGARHGALAGTVIGSLISNNAADTPGNELQKPIQKRPKRPQTYQPYKTRSRFPVRNSSRNKRRCYPNRFNRYSDFSR